MKRLIVSILLMLVLFCPKMFGGCEIWSSLGLPVGDVQTTAIDPKSPNMLYAATMWNGIFKSTDSGRNWAPFNTGITNTSVRALAIDPVSTQTVYVGTNGGGIFKSSNGGGNWRLINTGLTNHWVSSIKIDPSTPQTLYAGTNGGVFKSTNGGDRWIEANTGLTNPYPQTIAIDPTRPQTIYTGTYGGGVYKSIDGAGHWSVIRGLTTPNVFVLAVDPNRSEIIYAGTQDGLFRSDDGGNSWRHLRIGEREAGGPLLIDPLSPQTIYAGNSFEIYKSTDGGSTWTKMNTSNDVWPEDLAIDPSSGKVYASAHQGLYAYLPTCFDLPVSAGGAAGWRTAGEDGNTKVGFAELQVDSGAAPYGTAVFSYRQNGVVVSEAGVPASPPTTRARIFIDYRKGVNPVPGRSSSGTVDINTGIAVTNNGSAVANMIYTLRGVDGAVLTSGGGMVGKGMHFARFIDNLESSYFYLPRDFQFGSLEIDSDQPLSIVALRMTVNQKQDTLYTTIPVADLTDQSSRAYFPQFVDGGGYTTTIVLVNSSNSTERGTLQILDNNGAPLVVNAGGTADSSFSYLIPPGGTFRLQTDGSPDVVKAGWVKLIPDVYSPIPTGFGLFGFNPGNILVSESGIPAMHPTTHARIYVDLSAKHNTGLAIANPEPTPANITISAFRTDGTTRVGTSLGPLQLDSGGHEAGFADHFVSDLPVGFVGVLDVNSTTPFAALTLRSLINERDDFLMTTFPVADANRASPTPIVFPHVVDQGGYATEFILISSGETANTVLGFYDVWGQPTYFEH